MSSHLHTPADEVHESFTVCTVCMRVQRGSRWVEAEQVIREVVHSSWRSFRRCGPGCAPTAARPSP